MLPNFEVKVAPDDGMRRPFVLSDPFGQDSICCTQPSRLSRSNHQCQTRVGPFSGRLSLARHAAHTLHPAARTPPCIARTRTAEPNGK